MRRPLVKLAPDFCHCEATRGAIEQPRAELPFKPADSFRHCRFRQSQFFGSADKGMHLHDLREDRQAFEIRKIRHAIYMTLCRN